MDLLNGVSNKSIGLFHMKERGCSVEVLNYDKITNDSTQNNLLGGIDQGVLNALKSHNIKISLKDNIHSKVLAISARTAENGIKRNFLFVGSENFTYSAIPSNNLWAKIPCDKPEYKDFYTSYLTHYNSYANQTTNSLPSQTPNLKANNPNEIKATFPNAAQIFPNVRNAKGLKLLVTAKNLEANTSYYFCKFPVLYNDSDDDDMFVSDGCNWKSKTNGSGDFSLTISLDSKFLKQFFYGFYIDNCTDASGDKCYVDGLLLNLGLVLSKTTIPSGQLFGSQNLPSLLAGVGLDLYNLYYK